MIGPRNTENCITLLEISSEYGVIVIPPFLYQLRWMPTIREYFKKITSKEINAFFALIRYFSWRRIAIFCIESSFGTINKFPTFLLLWCQ